MITLPGGQILEDFGMPAFEFYFIDTNMQWVMCKFVLFFFGCAAGSSFLCDGFL